MFLAATCWACSENNELLPPPGEEETTEETTTARLNIELNETEQVWASGGNAFAMNLFTVTCEESDNENVLLSPLSLQFALGMLSNGANEAGMKEIATAMGFKDYSQSDVNSYFNKLSSSLAEGDPSVALNLANSAWIQNNFVVKEAFTKTLTDSYQAQVSRVDFSKRDEVMKMINDWSSEQTMGKINKLDLDINALTRLILANACYLKGNWTIPFEQVEKGTFTTSGGKMQDVSMMKLNKTFNYYEHADYQAVELPYGNESFSMVVVLPAEGKSVEETVAAIEWENVRFSGRNVEITLPKFKLESHTELIPVLKKMGINEALNTLPNIADGLAVSQAFQDMFIETNETGTEAAAVTVIIIDVIAPGPEITPAKPVMTMDRPFLFTIRENSTGVILFMGKVGSINE